MSLNSCPIDRVVVSGNTDPKFLDFWPIIAWGWRRLFRVPVHLALVVEGPVNVPKSGGIVTKLDAVPGIPTANQGKVARYFLASMFRDSKVTILNDLDLLPLNRPYLEKLISARPVGALMTVGSELYTGPEHGKFTAGNLTAESDVFHRLINPGGLPWDEFVKSFVGLKKFDHKEDITSRVHHENPDTFSDESLLRYLLWKNPVPVCHLTRGFYPYTAGALCRTDWRFDPALIKNGTMKEAHLPRPYAEHRDKVDALVNFLRESC